MALSYDSTDERSITQYAQKLVGKNFVEVVMENTEVGDQNTIMKIYGNVARKGGLGNLLEKVYFGYSENSNQEADFKEAGIELKVTPYEKTSTGELRAGERVVITMISYDKPFEVDFYKSHAWEKMRKMLLIYYWRNRELENNLFYPIKFVTLFTPPENDLQIIKHDYEVIKEKVMAGKAHELSESDTLYLGACTKGSTAAKSLVPQYYNKTTLAKKRAFCFKNSYMSFVLTHYIAGKKNDTESVLNKVILEKEDSFEKYVERKINAYSSYSVDELCKSFNVDSGKNPKNLEAMLVYRILGISGNRAEEFEKANVVVKTIRIERSGRIKENMSFPVFKFKELVNETWENSSFGNYLRETRFFFVVFRYDDDNCLKLKGSQFWNIPYADLEEDVKTVWERTKTILLDGLQVIVKNGKNYNNFPKQTENRVSHVRPHAQNANDTYELPDGRQFSKQCFWLNNSYILEQLHDDLKR